MNEFRDHESFEEILFIVSIVAVINDVFASVSGLTNDH